LVANPANWRVHPSHQQAALAGSLDSVGWVQQVLVNRQTGFVVDGHARVALAIERDEPAVPVLYVDLTPDEERIVLATLDPIAALAGADDGKLADLLASVAVDDAGLQALLDSLAPAPAWVGRTDPDDAIPLPSDPYVASGDLFRLGRHRLLVGDATDAGDVARLLDGARPGLTISDAPYGIQLDPGRRAGAQRLGRVPNDDRADWRAAWALSPSDVLYIWHAGLRSVEVGAGLEASGFAIRAQIIWAKPSLQISRGAYSWQHEPCFYAVRKGATAAWIGDRKQSTLWAVPHVHRTQGTSDDVITGHGTQKPVEVMARPLRNHRGDVYDPFVGSGTTLIAAEQEGRACYAMDVDPAYAQVALERWQAFTGKAAEQL
jgi:DNA modification methylase